MTAYNTVSNMMNIASITYLARIRNVAIALRQTPGVALMQEALAVALADVGIENQRCCFSVRINDLDTALENHIFPADFGDDRMIGLKMISAGYCPDAPAAPDQWGIPCLCTKF